MLFVILPGYGEWYCHSFSQIFRERRTQITTTKVCPVKCYQSFWLHTREYVCTGINMMRKKTDTDGLLS